ncbi:transposase [Enterocloster bolteae]|uniref:transposase n=1 Tax=unclassified Clostridium TaxID=2614128 RepID=UPI001D06F6D0|nr:MULTISPECIES: transposase [Clostridia]MCB7092344.1 transposase [Enterocloster bolteae]MCH1938844.1 transposase [Enterocloster sp. OA11]
MECFVPLMEKFREIYGHFPGYPVADDAGSLLCPNGKRFCFKCKRPVYKNQYGRTEELYECEPCGDKKTKNRQNWHFPVLAVPN